MKFYLEHATAQDKKNRKNTGNCIAVTSPKNHGYNAIAPAPNTGANAAELCDTGVSKWYLQTHCTKITQEEAAIHHPNLFSFLGINI